MPPCTCVLHVQAKYFIVCMVFCLSVCVFCLRDQSLYSLKENSQASMRMQTDYIVVHSQLQISNTQAFTSVCILIDTPLYRPKNNQKLLTSVQLHLERLILIVILYHDYNYGNNATFELSTSDIVTAYMVTYFTKYFVHLRTTCSRVFSHYTCSIRLLIQTFLQYML